MVNPRDTAGNAEEEEEGEVIDESEDFSSSFVDLNQSSSDLKLKCHFVLTVFAYALIFCH